MDWPELAATKAVGLAVTAVSVLVFVKVRCVQVRASVDVKTRLLSPTAT